MCFYKKVPVILVCGSPQLTLTLSPVLYSSHTAPREAVGGVNGWGWGWGGDRLKKQVSKRKRKICKS